MNTLRIILIASILLSTNSTFSETIPHCDLASYPQVVWYGSRSDSLISFKDLASYCAPIFWFSPDEPTLKNKKGRDIRIPALLPSPFEANSDTPVVYYQYNRILERPDAEGPGYRPHSEDKNKSTINLNNIDAAHLKFLAYFPFEEGLGSHKHDIESVEFRIFVLRSGSKEWGKKFSEIQCKEVHYIVEVRRITAEAHGRNLYYNILVPDEYTKFPIHLLVEEGKHGLCTDRNGDGYYTPGYDVNKNINDAWGIRDIIRSGFLFSGNYQAWMTKVRRPEHKVFPPIPKGSHLRLNHTHKGQYSLDNAIYELRAFPPSKNAKNDTLQSKMEEKEQKGWPLIKKNGNLGEHEYWVPLSLAIGYDDGPANSLLFPFLIIKNPEVPITGGFLIHRFYLKAAQKKGQKFGWMLMYTPSASRWIDKYFSAGVEWNIKKIENPLDNTKTTNCIYETGVKFRINIPKGNSKFRNVFAGYWGLRFGIKYTGFRNIDRLNYIFEIGPGIW